MRRPLTELTDADRLALTPLFSMRAEQNWPAWTRRVFRALHLPDATKFDLCWEEYNLIPPGDRDRVFRTLDIPGSVLVPLDNKPVQVASKILKIINPLAWVLSPLDRKLLTPWARKALAPLTAIAADLPSSQDRDKDARAWRQVLSYAPAKIATVITRMIIADLAVDFAFGVDTAAADTSGATQYDPGSADVSGDDPATADASGYPDASAAHETIRHAVHGASHLGTAHLDSAAVHQAAEAFRPLVAAVKSVHAHGLADGARYAEEVVRAAHKAMEDLPPDLRHLIHTTHTVLELAEKEPELAELKVLTFTAF
jgi:hypothetical protein